MLALVKGKTEEAKNHRKRILIAMKTKEDREDWLLKAENALKTTDH